MSFFSRQNRPPLQGWADTMLADILRAHDPDFDNRARRIQENSERTRQKEDEIRTFYSKERARAVADFEKVVGAAWRACRAGEIHDGNRNIRCRAADREFEMAVNAVRILAENRYGKMACYHAIGLPEFGHAR